VKNYTVKKTSEVNASELKSFYKNSYRSRGTIFSENYRWFYKSDFIEETPLVICDKELIVGHAGILSDTFIFNGKEYKFIWLTDLIIISSHRKLGLGNQLVKEWMLISENQITIPNDIALNIYKKFNWKESNQIARYVYPTIIEKIFLKKIFKEKYPKLKFFKIDKNIVKDISGIEKLNKSSNGLMILRNEDWFDWRFLQCPFIEDLTCFQYENQFIIAQTFREKNKDRIHILYSTEKYLEKSDIFELLKIWAINNGIKYLWYISNIQNIKSNPISFMLKKKMNFAFNSSSPELTEQLKKGIMNIQGADSDSGHLILF